MKKGDNIREKYSLWKIGGIGLTAGLFNGLLGSGGGIIIVPAMIHLLKLEEHDAHATAIAVILPLSLISVFVYYNKGYFDWGTIWKVAIGSIIGSTIGAWLLPRIPANMLNRIFGIFMILAGLRMIF